MKKIVFIIYILILIFFFDCCKKQENEVINEKINEEINYVDGKLINMLNELNNISLENFNIIYNQIELKEESSSSNSQKQQENQGSIQAGEEKDSKINTSELKQETILGNNEEEINWSLLEEEIEILNTSWSVILLDLYSLDIGNTEILAFSNKLNNTIISIENKDKTNTLINLRDLYSYLPLFLESSNLDKNLQIIKQAKLYLINSYVYVNEEEWNSAQNELVNCEEEYNKLANDLNYIENREYKVNKIYILVKELENSLASKDKKVFYIKYKNLLQSINSI